MYYSSGLVRHAAADVISPLSTILGLLVTATLRVGHRADMSDATIKAAPRMGH